MTAVLAGKRIHITGVVQGVGFRPFVYGLAARYGLLGWVCNTSAGVDIEVDGASDVLDQFVAALFNETPPLAKIDSIDVADIAGNGFSAFEIRHSIARPDDFMPISPDIALCDDCRRELFDPRDRRYLYPFINCTNCGPRFTIIKDIPYDRPFTTMADFALCDDCAKEYADPLNRRFHAQPVACPKCGPKVWRVDKETRKQDESANQRISESAIQEVRNLLGQGAIVAIKGLGGFHLACDATNDEAVKTLRERKGRIDKPFALMAANVEVIETFCEVTPEERTLLESNEKPIVLLKKRVAWLETASRPSTAQQKDAAPLRTLATPAPTDRCGVTHISPYVAPGQATLGVMLPYTPLHELLLADGNHSPLTTHQSPIVLVMTSGNFSEEPIATSNDDAVNRLADLADTFLLHDRDIHVRCDDSVVRVFEGQELPIRRSRGHAPYPVKLPFTLPPMLAAGGELKNTFCVTRDNYAFLSHHIGDLENFETLKSFEDGVEHFERLFRIKPEIVAYDLHPDYLATRYALDRAEKQGLRAIGVQHHHAHIAACMAENGLSGERPVIGVAFDGTGYGTDGAIWGGEFLIADYGGFERAAQLDYVPLPGGDAATKNVYRIALSYLQQAGIEWADDLAPVNYALRNTQYSDTLGILAHQIQSRVNSPLTSSMGRLFDAVASICGVRQSVNYEGQAAIEFEARVDANEHGRYEFVIEVMRNTYCVKADEVMRAVVADVRSGVPTPVISARFHTGLALMVRSVCESIRDRRGLNEVALSGGVWQNVTLLSKSLAQLRAANFTVYVHRLVPPNDGGLALGQAVVAAHS
ncbi:MAG: carbamoyltransferase HypF [Thermoflexales bacterium]|nr:carbamoyltransferase HypF [Thermoflexales bacterium]